MDRSERLRLSAEGKYGYAFRQGMFVRLYEQSLYWFVTHIKQLKPMLERLKDGEPLVYSTLPVPSFEKLISKGALQAVTTKEYGWSWLYAEQTLGANKDFSDFPAWREAALNTYTKEALSKPMLNSLSYDKWIAFYSTARPHSGLDGKNIQMCYPETFKRQPAEEEE